MELKCCYILTVLPQLNPECSQSSGEDSNISLSARGLSALLCLPLLWLLLIIIIILVIIIIIIIIIIIMGELNNKIIR